MSCSNGSRRCAGTAVLAWREQPLTLAHRGPVSRGASPSEPKPAPIRCTCCPARAPKAIRCWTDAAMVRASSGAVSRRGSYPLATASSMPASRYPRWRNARMTRRLIFWITAAMAVSVGGLTREKAWLQTLVSAIEKHSLQEEQVKVHVEIERTAKALDKGDRARVDGGPLMTLCDRLVDVILSDGGANDGVDLGSEVLRRRHPVAQGDRHRDDPLAGGDPGNDLLDEMRRHLRHAAAGTRRTKPAPFATEGYQQLLLAGVTAQAEKAIGKDAAP